MWSNGPLLLLRVRIRQKGGGFRLFLGLAGYAVSQWLLSFAPVLEWLPGKLGDSLREKEALLLSVLKALSDGSPELSVDLTPKDGDRVTVKLWSPFGKGGSS